jgi:hypothetical protein
VILARIWLSFLDLTDLTLSVDKEAK